MFFSNSLLDSMSDKHFLIFESTENSAFLAIIPLWTFVTLCKHWEIALVVKYTHKEKPSVINFKHPKVTKRKKKHPLSLTFGYPLWLSLKRFQFILGLSTRICSHTQLIMSSIITFTYYHCIQWFDIQQTWNSCKKKKKVLWLAISQRQVMFFSFCCCCHNWTGRKNHCGIMPTMMPRSWKTEVQIPSHRPLAQYLLLSYLIHL